VAATLTSDSEITYASFPIEKVQQDADGNVTVWGKATDDSLDSDHQIIDPDFAAKAMAEFFDSGPNIRVQHQAQRDPAGVGISFERDGTSHWMKSRIIEPVAKQLVLGGALRAYSVGIARPTIQRDGVARGGRITDGQFVEISLVDRPANKNCGIQLVKRASDGTIDLTTKVFGGDILEKSEDVTLTVPADIQMSFSPLDMAKIIARRSNGSGNGMIVKVAEPEAVKGKKKRMMQAAAQAAGVEADDDKSATAMGSPNTVGGMTQAKSDDPADEAVSAALDAAQAAQSLDTDKKVQKRKLTSAARDALPSSDFVFPDTRKYPVHDKKHARNALSRVAANGTPEEQAKVRAAVAARYPGIGKKAEKAGAAMNPSQASPASMKKDKSLCPDCGAMQNREHAYCTECGKAMMAAPEIAKNHDFLCLGCGRELDKGEKFCPQCGKANPGHNPMADLKIPANKNEGSRVADDVTQAVTDQDGEQAVVKAKKSKGDRKATRPGQMPGEDTGSYEAKKGKKKPFGGSQAPPFGKKPDGDADDAKKTADAPLTAAKAKAKPARPVDTGETPGHDATAQGSESAVPGHRDGEAGYDLDRDSSPGAQLKGADPVVGTQLRLKYLGIDTMLGYAHDLSCAAFSWEDVAKSYPSGLELLDAQEWQVKSLEAAANAPLAEAQAASRMGQAAYAIKSAELKDLIDVKGDLYKAFKDANPGPGSFPTPHEICADHFTRPQISSGRASYGAHYGPPHSAPVPPEGGMSAQHFHRENLRGEITESPANKGRAPVPDPPGVVMNLDYSSINKDQILAAYSAMHDHFDRVFPGVCPMIDQGRAAHPVVAAKAETGAAVTKKVSKDGMTKKQRARRAAKLTRQVMKGKMPLDQARIKMGKKPIVSPEPLKPLKGQEAPEVIKGELITSQDALTRKDLRAVLAKSQKSQMKEIAELRTLVAALADQPDPGTQPWKGIAMNPMRTKSSAPAAVASVAEAAERSQMMVMHQLEQTARDSTNPALREAAWQAHMKMKGFLASQ
jgi:Double zinc ribbon